MHKCDEQKKCVNDALAKAEAVCQERGLRFTEIRKFILRLIWDNPKPSKAYDLLDEVSKMNYSAKPPTVYRALDFLLENGFIHKINTLNAYIACTHTLKHDHCYFIICDKCDPAIHSKHPSFEISSSAIQKLTDCFPSTQ